MSSMLGFALKRLENSLFPPSCKWIPFCPRRKSKGTIVTGSSSVRPSVRRKSRLRSSSYGFQGILMKLSSYCSHDLIMSIFYRGYAQLIFVAPALARCDIGVRFSVRQSVRPSFRLSSRPQFTSTLAFKSI